MISVVKNSSHGLFLTHFYLKSLSLGLSLHLHLNKVVFWKYSRRVLFNQLQYFSFNLYFFRFKNLRVFILLFILALMGGRFVQTRLLRKSARLALKSLAPINLLQDLSSLWNEKLVSIIYDYNRSAFIQPAFEFCWKEAVVDVFQDILSFSAEVWVVRQLSQLESIAVQL